MIKALPYKQQAQCQKREKRKKCDEKIDDFRTRNYRTKHDFDSHVSHLYSIMISRKRRKRERKEKIIQWAFLQVNTTNGPKKKKKNSLVAWTSLGKSTAKITLILGETDRQTDRQTVVIHKARQTGCLLITVYLLLRCYLYIFLLYHKTIACLPACLFTDFSSPRNDDDIALKRTTILRVFNDKKCETTIQL